MKEYSNFEELKDDVAKYHSVHCAESISNIDICCRVIAKAIKDGNCKKAYDEMWRFTGIFGFATKISYDKDLLHHLSQALNKAQLLEKVTVDFIIAESEIKEYYCNNYLTGKFNILDALNTHPMCVDWDAYYNASSRNFIDACKEADAIVGFTEQANAISESYKEDERYNFKELYYSAYNERVYASFESEDDAYYWDEYGYVHKEEDGLYWSDLPSY